MRRVPRILLVAVVLVTVAFAASASSPPASAAWRWPLRGDVGRSFVVVPARPYAAGQHRGVDLRARPGTVVRSACAGRVRFAGRVGRHGGVVSVRCGALDATYLELGAVAVRRGRGVAAGQRLGAVGPAVHLHLGAREAAGARRYLDPLRLLGTPRGPSLGPAPDALPPVRRARPPAAARPAGVRALAPRSVPA